MSKQPARTWSLVVTLGVPLTVVGGAAMAISYATLIDVARVNGLPLPELFPVLIDVGTVASMIAAAQYRLRGIPGRWVAYLVFGALSVVSIVANATHAWRVADMTQTTAPAAAILAAVPPAALLAITHLVMGLIPDAKERQRLQARRSKEEPVAFPHPSPSFKGQPARSRRLLPEAAPPAPVSPAAGEEQSSLVSPGERQLRLVGSVGKASDEEVTRMVLDYIDTHGRRPTGEMVGVWRGGQSRKTGQRFLTKLAAEGIIPSQDDAVQVVNT